MLWIPVLGNAIERCDVDAFTQLFLPEGYWRDILLHLEEADVFRPRRD